MQKKVEMNINKSLFASKKISTQRISPLINHTSAPSALKNTSFHETAKKVIIIQRSLSAMGYRFRRLRPPRLRGGTICYDNLPLLRKNLIFRVIVEMRDELKILHCSTHPSVKAPGTLFSWYLKDYKNRMHIQSEKLVAKFEENAKKDLPAMKINADITGLIEITEFIGEDIRKTPEDYQGTIKLVEEMKQYLDIQNTSHQNYVAQVKLLRSLEDRIKAGEEVNQEKLPGYSSQASLRLQEDDVRIDDELVHLSMDMNAVNRYNSSFTKAQLEEVEFNTQSAEYKLIQTTKEFNLNYQREKEAHHAIKKTNNHIINKLKDEISIMSQKYEYEYKKCNLEIDRKQYEIVTITKKLQAMKKKYEQRKKEIGDQVPYEVEKPTVWSVLDKVIRARVLQKEALEDAALQKMKIQKTKPKKAKAKEKGSDGTSQKWREKGSKKVSDKGSNKGNEKPNLKGSNLESKKGKGKGMKG